MGAESWPSVWILTLLCCAQDLHNEAITELRMFTATPHLRSIARLVQRVGNVLYGPLGLCYLPRFHEKCAV